jgi:transcriptional regulator with XRE-family HTH domain
MSRKETFDYPQIDLKKTGEWLRTLCKYRGYTVKDIQEYLHISSNQAIYEWFNGHTLPSVNNLLALSMLLKVPMNQLLVDDVHDVIYKNENYAEGTYKRCLAYILQMNNYIIRMEKKHG